MLGTIKRNLFTSLCLAISLTLCMSTAFAVKHQNIPKSELNATKWHTIIAPYG